ncbi:flippase-like domain-containing protein [Streptomyces sp. PSKA54]|uniref:Flippase-like domain-containing protein n=1 Tax=Streptomyces himalayensis subsp. aureolus TaxID=2758039 RepID=A0A7W2D703_9ACTN|nr:flippase-like domain-containing protein [Streptomyces himalayensis subsp. aureolus]
MPCAERTDPPRAVGGRPRTPVRGRLLRAAGSRLPALRAVRTGVRALGAACGAVRKHLPVLAGAIILALLIWRLGTGAFVDGLRRIDGPTLLAALGIGLLTTILSAWRWCLVARGLGMRLPLGGAVADYYRALFLNAALPGGVLGDVHRAVRHGQSAGDIGRGVRAVVLERVAGQVVLIVAGVAILSALPTPALAGVPGLSGLPGLPELGRMPHRLAMMPDATLPLAVVVLSVFMTVVALRLRARRRLRQEPGPGSSRSHRAFRAALTEARSGLLARGIWPGVVVSSVVVLAGHVAMFLLAARVAGVTAPAAALVPLAVLALIAMALPLNVGGWGPREGVTAWAFGAAGLGSTQGLTVSVVYGVLAFAAGLPGAGVLLGRWLARVGTRRSPAAARIRRPFGRPLNSRPFAGAVLVGRRRMARLRRAQVEFVQRVLAEDRTSDGRTECVPHHHRAGEAEPRDAVAEEDRCHRDVEPVQRALVQEARHGDAAALDQQTAQAASREGLHKARGSEGVTVGQGEYVDPVRNGGSLAVLADAHHPQGGG